jgi:hypothetical protein
MGIQIVIFLAFTSVTLVFNSLVIWFAYKAFANIADRVTDTMRELRDSGEVAGWLRALENASSQAVTLTDATQKRLNQFEPILARAQSQFGYGLAKVDVRVESLCENIRHHSGRAQDTVLAPARHIGAVMSGVREVLEYLTGSRNGADANSTPTK